MGNAYTEEDGYLKISAHQLSDKSTKEILLSFSASFHHKSKIGTAFK